MEPSAEYEFDHCRPDELLGLVDLANRVFRAQRPGDMAEEYPLVFELQNIENLRVARWRGRIVSHVGLCIRDASILGARLRVACIGAVATDPEHRGRGLATRLMEDARRHAVEQGASLMLISGGRDLYRRLGYIPAGFFQAYRVPAGEPEPEFELTPLGEEDLSAIITLYQREPIRFFRPREDWHKLLAAGMLMNRPADLLVVRHRNAIVAYAGVQRPVPAQGGEAPAARVREIGGSRAALAAVLPGIARRYEVPAVDLVTWPSDAEWRSQAFARGWQWLPAAFPGTVGIIDPERFLRAIRRLVEERAGSDLRLEPAGEAGWARLVADEETTVLATMAELTALVFGSEAEEGRALAELPPTVRDRVSAVFPLPLLWYGYNYV